MKEDVTQNHMIRSLMMIDDNPIDQSVYKRLVERSGLVETLIQFTDAELALAHLVAPDSVMPDLILLDINMPGMSGFEFLQAAGTRLGADMSPVVIMLTTSLNPSDRKTADSFPAIIDFLNKPLSLDLLREIAVSFRAATTPIDGE